MNLAKEKWTNLKQDFCHFHPLHQQTLEFAPGRSGFVEVHSSPSPQVATSLATKRSREKKKIQSKYSNMSRNMFGFFSKVEKWKEKKTWKN